MQQPRGNQSMVVLPDPWACGSQLRAQCHWQDCWIPAPYTVLPTGYPMLWRRLVGHICTSKSCQDRTQLCLLQLSELFSWQVSPQQDSGLIPPAMASQGLVKIWDTMFMSAHPLHSSRFCHLWTLMCRSWILRAHPVWTLAALLSGNVRGVTLLNADEISGSA